MKIKKYTVVNSQRSTPGPVFDTRAAAQRYHEAYNAMNWGFLEVREFEEEVETFEVNIPFSGFYSAHDTVVQDEYDREFTSRDSGYHNHRAFDAMFGESLMREFWNRVSDAISWHDVYVEYAKEYVESFMVEFDLDGEFEIMTSPRFYNFETDRLFAQITRDSLAKIARAVLLDPDNRAEFTANCVRKFKSRDGFISHYDYRWKTWGRVSEWDYNQLGVLLLTFIELESGGDWGFYEEYALMEGASGNGKFYDWFYEHQRDGEYDRLRDIYEWMDARVRRGPFTMADYVAARRAENRPFADTPLGGHFHA